MKTRATIASEPNRPPANAEIAPEGLNEAGMLIRSVTTSLCQTDLLSLAGKDPLGLFPVIPGPEGRGMVGELAKGVTSVQPGEDHIALCAPGDMRRPRIRLGMPNRCQAIRETQGAGLMSDGMGKVRIIGIETSPAKLSLARSPGAHDCTSPKDVVHPVQQDTIETTDGGLDYALESIGTAGAICAAPGRCQKGRGECTQTSVAGAGEISTWHFQPVTGRGWRGPALGEGRGRAQLAGNAGECLRGDFSVDSCTARHMSHDRINTGFALPDAGEAICPVIPCQPQVNVLSSRSAGRVIGL